MVTVADIIAFRLRTETLVRPVSEAEIRTECGVFRAVIFENALDRENHIALVKGTILADEPTLVRVQEQATLVDVFHCQGWDQSIHLHQALRMIQSADRGVFVYLRQEGHGACLSEDLKFHALRGQGTGSYAPAVETPLREDLRLYGIGAQILRQLGVGRIRLLTNHPRKIVGLQGYGLAVVEQVPLGSPVRHSALS
jgi:3,4-dihydroxy 2-butanone 4-phosphate synthase/GTP cyclohydrolase II